MGSSEPALVPGDVVDAPPPGREQWLFTDRRIAGVTFRGLADAWGWLQFRNCAFVECTFERCEVNWRFGGRGFEQDAASWISASRFVRCDLRQFKVAYGGVEGSVFENCRWDFPNFLRNTDLISNRFIGIVRRLIILGQDDTPPGEMSQPRARANVIRGNDFRAADLRELELRNGVPVEDQLWPEGPNCGVIDRYPERMEILLSQLQGRDDNEAKRWRIWLSTLAIHHGPATQQQSTWERWDDPSKNAIWNGVLAALAAVELDGAPRP